MGDEQLGYEVKHRIGNPGPTNGESVQRQARALYRRFEISIAMISLAGATVCGYHLHWKFFFNFLFFCTGPRTLSYSTRRPLYFSSICPCRCIPQLISRRSAASSTRPSLPLAWTSENVSNHRSILFPVLTHFECHEPNTIDVHCTRYMNSPIA